MHYLNHMVISADHGAFGYLGTQICDGNIVFFADLFYTLNKIAADNIIS